MQDNCAVADFNYLNDIGLCKSVEGIVPLELNDFVGKSWVLQSLDDLWIKNYIVNRKIGIERFAPCTKGRGKMTVLVGASPSVLKHVDQLKELGENYIIIACNTVYGLLVSSGVKVDYVMAVEAHDHILHDFDIQDDRTELIASPFVCPSVLDVWRGKKWFYYLGGGYKYQSQIETDGIEDIDIGGGNTVSTSACFAYKYLHSRSFVFIGTSFCYYDDYYFDKRSTEHVCDFSHESKRIMAVDMYGKIVKTTPSQLSYKTWLESFIRYVNNATFVNATEDGILGVVPEIVSFDGTEGQYTIKYLPWINIVPFTIAVEAFNQRIKENKDGSWQRL